MRRRHEETFLALESGAGYRSWVGQFLERCFGEIAALLRGIGLLGEFSARSFWDRVSANCLGGFGIFFGFVPFLKPLIDESPGEITADTNDDQGYPDLDVLHRRTLFFAAPHRPAQGTAGLRLRRFG